MSVLGMILQWIVMATWWTIVTVIIVIITWWATDKYVWPAIMYWKAKKVIVPWVESYKRRCTGNNRFVVTVETLQDSFREYDTDTIKKVWLYLIDQRLIVTDPQDGEWCIR